MVDFEAICQVAYASSTFVSVGYYYDFVSAIYELRGKLIDVRFNSP
jgi:hypothetical protein